MAARCLTQFALLVATFLAKEAAAASAGGPDRGDQEVLDPSSFFQPVAGSGAASNASGDEEDERLPEKVRQMKPRARFRRLLKRMVVVAGRMAERAVEQEVGWARTLRAAAQSDQKRNTSQEARRDSSARAVCWDEQKHKYDAERNKGMYVFTVPGVPILSQKVVRDTISVLGTEACWASARSMAKSFVMQESPADCEKYAQALYNCRRYELERDHGKQPAGEGPLIYGSIKDHQVYFNFQDVSKSLRAENAEQAGWSAHNALATLLAKGQTVVLGLSDDKCNRVAHYVTVVGMFGYGPAASTLKTAKASWRGGKGEVFAPFGAGSGTHGFLIVDPMCNGEPGRYTTTGDATLSSKDHAFNAEYCLDHNCDITKPKQKTYATIFDHPCIFEAAMGEEPAKMDGKHADEGSAVTFANLCVGGGKARCAYEAHAVDRSPGAKAKTVEKDRLKSRMQARVQQGLKDKGLTDTVPETAAYRECVECLYKETFAERKIIASNCKRYKQADTKTECEKKLAMAIAEVRKTEPCRDKIDAK